MPSSGGTHPEDKGRCLVESTWESDLGQVFSLPDCQIPPFKKGAPGWLSQSVECQTLDFGSGHGPRVMGPSPVFDSVLNVEPAEKSLSFPLPLSPAHTL